MKVVLLNCFDTYEERIDLLCDFFIGNGYEVTVIQSNFRHFKKEYRNDMKKNFYFVKTKSYYKNISVSRLKSHYKFAKDSMKFVERINPDLLYVMLPPNSLAKFSADYKRKNKNTRLIFDLIDLWPETMPLGKVENVPPFTFWRLMRDLNLKYADVVLTECNLYQEILSLELNKIKSYTLYLAKKEVKINLSPFIHTNEINLCYLGSINNIIDITKIKRLIQVIQTSQPVKLHIIGDGESKESFINEVKQTGATVEYYGKIYDETKKQEIIKKCHFGLNIMKESVCVGLTMKSIDYFQHGLPILNNIKADTTNLVEKYDVGFNIADDNLVDVVNKITKRTAEEHNEMRKNTIDMFNKLFSQQVFNNRMKYLIEEMYAM